MEKKYSKKDYIFNLILALFVIGIALLVTRFKYLYGSTTDWESQHYYLPEYFRNQFYATGKLIPEFAANIGAGENIFNYSYYGLLNPFILFSYLLPFISMRNYIMFGSILLVIISGWLFYRWIYLRFGTRVAFFSSFLFICATPLLFHSHRHVMFVSYMPFMILALMGVDKYFTKKKRLLLIVSATLMIFTSYFFSVGGLIALTIYGIGVYLEDTKDITVMSFIKDGAGFAINLICSVMMAGVLLLPTVYTLLSGRSESNVTIDYKSLLLPEFHDGFVIYDTYSLGLTGIFVIAVIYGVCSKYKKLRFISICFMCMTYIGIFVYILNGTMYMDGKALIPFLPVACYVTASMLNKLKRHEYDFKRLVKIVVIGNIPLAITFHTGLFFIYLLDLVVTMVGIYYFNSTSKFRYFAFNTMLIAAVICIVVNVNDELVEKKSEYIISENDQKNVIEQIGDSNTYRTGNFVEPLATIDCIYSEKQYSTTVYSSIYNMKYNKFFYDEICNENPYRNSAIMSQPQNLMFNLYMGNKYLIGTDIDIKGYKKNGMSSGNINVYENDDVNGLGYCTHSKINTQEYEKLSYPYNIFALYSAAVMDNCDVTDKEIAFPKVNELELGNLTQYDKSGVLQNDGDDNYVIINEISKEEKKSRISSSISVPVPEKYRNSVIFVAFDVDNTKYSEENDSVLSDYCNKDVIISINGIRNKLTDPDWKYYNNNSSFEYTIASNKSIDTLDFMFYDGVYGISNLRAYAVDYDDIIDMTSGLEKFNIDSEKTKGNVLEGDIDCKSDGYFVMSVPYDDGFDIMVDGESVTYELANTSFIGFDISKGKHHIIVTYHAPLLKEGKAVSGAGLILFMIFVVCAVVKRKNGEKKYADGISNSAML